MTDVVGAVGVGIAGPPALVAPGDDLPVNAFTHTFIENEVFADEF